MSPATIIFAYGTKPDIRMKYSFLIPVYNRPEGNSPNDTNRRGGTVNRQA